jgi:hypothetical protein
VRISRGGRSGELGRIEDEMAGMGETVARSSSRNLQSCSQASSAYDVSWADTS